MSTTTAKHVGRVLAVLTTLLVFWLGNASVAAALRMETGDSLSYGDSIGYGQLLQAMRSTPLTDAFDPAFASSRFPLTTELLLGATALILLASFLSDPARLWIAGLATLVTIPHGLLGLLLFANGVAFGRDGEWFLEGFAPQLELFGLWAVGVWGCVLFVLSRSFSQTRSRSEHSSGEFAPELQPSSV